MKRFTNREREVIELVLQGKTNKEIADELIISFHTVKAFLSSIYEKTGVHNRVQLALLIELKLRPESEKAEISE